jgi:hypothetical protein
MKKIKGFLKKQKSSQPTKEREDKQTKGIKANLVVSLIENWTL